MASRYIYTSSLLEDPPQKHVVIGGKLSHVYARLLIILYPTLCKIATATATASSNGAREARTSITFPSYVALLGLWLSRDTGGVDRVWWSGGEGRRR